jgi:hypothetical protein
VRVDHVRVLGNVTQPIHACLHIDTFAEHHGIVEVAKGMPVNSFNSKRLGDGFEVLVVGQFAVAGLYERRNLLNQNPAVIDRRYKKPN